MTQPVISLGTQKQTTEPVEIAGQTYQVKIGKSLGVRAMTIARLLFESGREAKDWNGIFVQKKNCIQLTGFIIPNIVSIFNIENCYRLIEESISLETPQRCAITRVPIVTAQSSLVEERYVILFQFAIVFAIKAYCQDAAVAKDRCKNR